MNICHSVKSKSNILERCPNKVKNNELFCGKHLNCKNLILFVVENNISINDTNNINEILDINIDINMDTDNLDIKNDDSKKEIDIKKKDNETIIMTKDELFNNITNNVYMSISSLRKSIKSCKLNKIFNTKLSKPLLISSIKKYIIRERYFISNLHSIILIQSFLRKNKILKRKQCNNDCDILTFTSIYDIPSIYFYYFYDKTTYKKYGYDIRTLYAIINSEYPSCPYTFRAFSDDEMNEINDYCNYLRYKGIEIGLEKTNLSPEEELEMKMKDVFHKINMLDNYTKYTWFKNLDLYQCMDLYIKLEDIWNYRSGMDFDAKKRIVFSGYAFNIPIGVIKNIKNKYKIQNLLLDEFDKMISEGVNRDEKKLGAILVLTGLVEVSYEAAIALPHLVQI